MKSIKSIKSIQSGIKSFQGIQGIQNIQGIQGIQNIQGIQGIQGNIRCIRNPQGIQGIQNIQGIQGIRNPQGIQSLQSIQGIQNIRNPPKIPSALPEKYYQKIVEKHLGSSHRKLQHCITDITTDKVHAEIKRWTRFAECIGQLITYQIQDPRPESHAYMFDDSCGPSKINTAIKTMRQAIPGIKLYTFELEEQQEEIRVAILDLETRQVIYRAP